MLFFDHQVCSFQHPGIHRKSNNSLNLKIKKSTEAATTAKK